MTIVGKILVFVILVFSLIDGAFGIMVYMARTRWAHDYTELRDRYVTADASNRAWEAEVKNTRDSADKRVGEVKALLKRVEEDLEAERLVSKGYSDELQKARLKNNETESTASLSLEEIKRRQEEFQKVRTLLEQERKENITLVEANNDLRQKAVTANIERQTVQDQNTRMLAQLQETQRALAEAQRRGGSSRSFVSNTNPPPENVEGLIKTADPSGLVTITIGSDAGIARGQTLQVYRLTPAPRYLGTIRILDVSNNQAVGQPIGRMAVPPQPGDHVSSRILGSS